MNQQESHRWITSQELSDEKMQVIIDFTDEKESKINPFDLPEDDEKYAWLVFAERLSIQEALEIIELAANNSYLKNQVANEISKRVRARLEIVS